jgi:predicted transcriptional regulator
MSPQEQFVQKKKELVQRVNAMNSEAFFLQLRALLDAYQSGQGHDFQLTEADIAAIAAGRADVKAGRVISLQDFRQQFGKYEP